MAIALAFYEARSAQQAGEKVFGRRQQSKPEERIDGKSALVEMLLDADETERKRLLLMALQTGELKMSESAELLRLVERLERVSGRREPKESRPEPRESE